MSRFTAAVLVVLAPPILLRSGVSLAQECYVFSYWGSASEAGLPPGATATLDLSRVAADCTGAAPCIFTTNGFEGDWNDVTDMSAWISWTFAYGPEFPKPTYKLTVEGLGDFEGQDQDGLLEVDAAALKETLAASDGQIDVENTGTEALAVFGVWVTSPSLCQCFAKTQTSKLISWKTATSGNFSTGSNWAEGAPPGSDSTANFNATGSYTVTLSKDVETDAILASQGGTVTLDLADYHYDVLQPDCSPLGIESDNAILRIENGELASAGDMVAIGAGSILVRMTDVEIKGASILLGDDDDRGSLTITDSAHVEVSTPGVVDVGADLNTNGGDLLIERAGELVVEAGVSFNDDGGTLANASTGAVRNAGSTLEARLVLVGGKGSATLSVTDSALVRSSVLDVGSLVGGFGTVNIEGGETALILESGFGRMGIGREGKGFVNVREGGKIESELGVLTLGEEFGGDGRMRIEDRDSFLKAGLVKVGVEGQGELVISDSATAEFFGLEIASGVSSLETSRLTVFGNGSKLQVTEFAPTWLARAGRGELSVLEGASVTIPQDFYVSVNAEESNPQGPAEGTIRVSGADAKLEVKGEMRVGVRAAGTVTIENSGSGDFDRAYIGYRDGDQPKQSRLEVTSSGQLRAKVLGVGRGTGVTRVRSGGRIDVTKLVIGELGGGKGEVQVEDPGSVVEADTAVVGDLGQGLLNTFSGGTAVIQYLKVNDGTVRGNVTIGSMAPKMETVSETTADSTRGTITVDALFFNEGAMIDADSVTFAGGLLGGTAAFPFPVINTGVVSPGDSDISPATFIAAAGYVQTVEGVLHIELAGEADGGDHDELIVTGTATLAGTLRLTVPRGYPYPVTGTTYRILSADTLEGTFGALDLQEGLEATVEYGDTEVTVTVTDFEPVSIEETPHPELPEKLVLHQNYPNPFNPDRVGTTIVFDVPWESDVKIQIFDALGRLVGSLGTRHLAPGTHSVLWDAKIAPSGIYFYRLEAGGAVRTGRMIVAR